MNVIDTAAREYANRPADERFPSLEALVNVAAYDRSQSAERDYNLKDLQVYADGVSAEDPNASIVLQSPKGTAKFSHWGFGQFSRMIGAPAAYLRSLPATIAAAAINFGIRATVPGQRASLLIRATDGDNPPMVRAATSDSYARVWDSELYGAVQRTIVERDPRWTLPPTWSGEDAGAYRGDRDSFLILVNGGSIVTDPSLANASGSPRPTSGASHGPTDGMYRGLLIRNSEVGASSITIETILYRYICGNHMLWGAMVDRSFRRRHVGTRVVVDSIREVAQFARNYANQSTDRDDAIIRTLIANEVATTKEGVIDELRKLGASKESATEAYTRCEQTEAASPRSFWGISQGLTRVSQDAGFQDERFVLDQLAAKVMARGARQMVAV